VTETPAKKLKRGQRKKMLAGRIFGRIFGQILQKRGQRNFSKEFPYFTVMANTQ
jgi:hypothetical protein